MASLAIGAGASLLGGISGKKGEEDAAKEQAKEYQAALNQEQTQFNTEQANEQPYMQAGNNALGKYGDLIGTNGTDAQNAAIGELQNSPLYTSQYNTGVNTVLQNAAATGGLRGGNTNNSLAQFGSSLLSNVIQNQLGNYSGLVNTGQSAAAGVNSATSGTSNSISNLLTQQGNSSAASTLAGANITGNTISSLGSTLANYLNQNSSSGLGNYAAYGW